MDYNKRFVEYAQRMNNMKCYFPFFHIYLNPHNDKTYGCDIPFLALDTLSFLFEEGKLKNRTLPLSEIEVHYTGILKAMYPDRCFSPQEIHEITMAITRILESPTTSGKRFNFSYSNYAVPKEESFYLSLITYDLKTSAYGISDAGLDLMINTKELFEEAKIEISLILVQYQLKNGYFDNALQTVRGLSAAVYRLKDEKKSVLEQLMYTGIDAFGTYKEFRDRVQAQLDTENTLFLDVNGHISQMIHELEDRLENDDISEKYADRDQYQILLDIKTEFESCFNLYTGLVSEYNGLFREFENISKIRLQRLGSKRFMFEDTMKEHVCANLPNEVHVKKVHPLLLPHIQKRFNPLIIYEPQQIIRKKVESIAKIERKIWTDEQSLDDQIDENQMTHFVEYSKLLLDLLAMSQTTDLKMFLSEVMCIKGLTALQNPSLIQFLVELNIAAEKTTNNDSELLTNDPFVTLFDCDEICKAESRTLRMIECSISEAQSFLGIQISKLKVVSFPKDNITIDENDGSYITNMMFSVEW
ncbi:MAG TPA: hypothetical protein HA261_05735 [Methanosarcina sp.]|nr:hypothetical protein [Methanosarcina sp.]